MIRLIFLLVSVNSVLAQTSADWLAQATALKAKGDAANALAAFEQAGILNPKSAYIQDEIGFLLAVQRQREASIARFEQAIALDPQSVLRSIDTTPPTPGSFGTRR